jgi:hypothetical protein
MLDGKRLKAAYCLPCRNGEHDVGDLVESNNDRDKEEERHIMDPSGPKRFTASALALFQLRVEVWSSLFQPPSNIQTDRQTGRQTDRQTDR